MTFPTYTRRIAAVFTLTAVLACTARDEQKSPAPIAQRPSILLVTLDTTRADAIGPGAKSDTPAFNALAAKGRLYRQAYSPVPQTLPSHSSIMTGLYPGGHGVRENARFLHAGHRLVAEQLRDAGYETAAFISAFALAKRFGIARGFDTWDEDFGEERAERDAKSTTDRAIAWLDTRNDAPVFLWVHYYDPHYPYTPPEPYRSRHASQPYLGEVEFMDAQLGRLVERFEKSSSGPKGIVVVSDHGEGLGEHGEAQHGNLLYQTTMHVPMLLAGPGISAGSSDEPVSIRRIYNTLLDWAGLDATNSLRVKNTESVVVGEAMKPFLDYGWQPQTMVVEGRNKAILAGRLEVYDVIADPRETNNLAATADLSREARATLRDYPIPSEAGSQAPPQLDTESERKLASLGYVGSTAKPVIRKDAPVPAEMTELFPILDRASGLFVREQYAEAIPLLEQIREADPWNLDAALRLATAHSALGNDERAVAVFRDAERISPDSPDVRTYLALHYAKGKEWQRAIPLLERIVAAEPDRLPPLEALAVIRERQERIEAAIALREKIYSMRSASGAELVRLATMEMRLGQTAKAIATFEKARAVQGSSFRNDLELGVLYLAGGDFAAARDALDRVPRTHPAWPMALFKRAQVSVLLREPDAPARIAAARANADETTKPLIANERLFR